jgi:hypothetical protein
MSSRGQKMRALGVGSVRGVIHVHLMRDYCGNRLFIVVQRRAMMQRASQRLCNDYNKFRFADPTTFVIPASKCYAA